jgi:hypothetical protein
MLRGPRQRRTGGLVSTSSTPMISARRIRLARTMAGLFAAIAVLAALPSAAAGGSRQEVTVEIFGWELTDRRQVTERGAHTAAVSWHFEVLNLSSNEPSICCDAGLHPLEWAWNTKTGSGTVSATWGSHHYFEPIAWEGRLSGRMSAAGGEGVMQMTEVFSGAKFHGKWTSPPVDPLGEGVAGLQFWTVDVTGTMG